MYPLIQPYDSGMLEVGEGNRVYWEACGNPEGKPAVVLHGGPGSGCSENSRRFFNPQAYRIILFDQRNCGRSTPHASNLRTDLSSNTTWKLVDDIERLRENLGIDRWLVFGGSWGSTLGLTYAIQHPERVSEIVLVGVTMTRPSEIDWLYHGVAPLFPEHYEKFRAGAPEAGPDEMVGAYYRLLNSGDPAVVRKAARDWCEWESALVSIDPDYQPDPSRLTDAFEIAFARIVTHYFHHHAWLEDGFILKNAGRLSGIPGVMVQGRLDLGGPLVTAWELARAWPDGDLRVINNAGHSSSDPGMPEAVIAATDGFANRG